MVSSSKCNSNSVVLKYSRSFFGWEISVIIIKTKKTFRLGYDVERIASVLIRKC